ncbi:MAG: flagellar biosynthesis protein FlhB [Gammaproteobacteria bacterium]
MAEDSGQDKTEDATPKRKEEARKEGDIPRSADLTTMMMMMTASIALLSLGAGVMEGIASLTKEFFMRAADVNISPHELPGIFMSGISHITRAMIPLVSVMVLVAIIAPTLLSGWNFSTKAMAFKFDKMDPIKGLGRVFGPNGLIEMFKTVLKFLVIATAAFFLIKSQMMEIMTVGEADLNSSLRHVVDLVAWTFLIVSSSTLLIVLVDVPQQLWRHSKKLKMSLEDIKKENKDTEGMPEVKARIRQKQQELAQRRMMEEVPKADVIVTNPTHFSVALKYDTENMGAPTVVAKGADEIAFKIREIGRGNQIPILETPPLARALYYSTKINQEIPAGLYKAVAQVLAYVFQLKANPNTDQVKPVSEDLPIPDELKR